MRASLVLAVLLLVGCGGQDGPTVDVTGWKATLAAEGVTVGNWEHFQRFYIVECQTTARDLAHLLVLRHAPARSTVTTGFAYQCPSQMGVLEKAYTRAWKHTADVRKACRTPRVLRTEVETLLGAALDC